MRAAEYQGDYYQIIGKTLLFMDHTNSRIKILTHDSLDSKQLYDIKQLARLNHLSKIISFAPVACGDIFKEAGFIMEGNIAGFFKGNDALCYSYFLDEERKLSPFSDAGLMLSEYTADRLSTEHLESKPAISLQPPYEISDAIDSDLDQMTALFQSVFSTYPSPVSDKEYIRSNMRNKKVIYKVALHYGKVIGIASAELDKTNLNAEMTDCVTMPEYRGRGILTAILQELEDQLQKDGYRCLYSLCRAMIPSVNRAFMNQGYNYAGRMIQNCHMCGTFEDMNIWVKNLP